MLTLIFMILLFSVFGRLFVFGLKAAWGISKIIVTVLFFPIVLIGMFLHGFVFLALICLIVFGVGSLLTNIV
ncbi:MAG: hypothetical protein MJ097_02415 [Dorea sp.]|nr:hypothetical protein [Dorea sp.]